MEMTGRGFAYDSLCYTKIEMYELIIVLLGQEKDF